jgi:colanic acid biosynthesis glycosyl transferase WcaI
LAKVLIIGINYSPETTGIAPYTTSLARHLVDAGHATTVITGFAHYPAWQAEPGEHRMRAAEWDNGARILRRRHFIPGSQSAITRALLEVTFLVHGAISRPERPDVVLGVIPSLSGGMLARFFAARARAPYGLIFQDLMAPAARQSGIGGGRRVAAATAALERWSVARATTVAIASEAFRPYIHGLGVEDARIMALPNWNRLRAPSGDRATTRDRLAWPPDRSVVLHAGNMGLKQGLEQVVEAARRADQRAAPVLFVLMGDGSQRAILEAQAAGIERLRFLPFQPEEDLPDVLNAADVLLVSERPSVIDMSLPSKLTSYFAVGRPIVAAVPATGSTALEVLQSAAGVIVPIGDPDALIDTVANLRASPDWAESLGLAGKAYAASRLDEMSALDRADELLQRTLGVPSSTRRSGWRTHDGP